MLSARKDLQSLKDSGEAPNFLTEEGLQTLTNGYLISEETPRNMYRRIAKAASSYYTDSEKWEQKFFDVMWKNWLCPASPILSNMGTTRGLPISCLAGNTWLNTRSGGIKMEDVSFGTELLTHKGRYRRVIAKKSRMSDGDLYELKVGTRTTPIQITGNHPILTNLGWVRVDEIDSRMHFVAVNSAIDNVEVEHTIRMQDYVSYPFVIDSGLICKKSENKNPRNVTSDGMVSYYSKVPEYVQVDEDLAWAMGLWFAEGSRTVGAVKIPNGIRITMGQDEIPEMERWLAIIKSKFNANGNYYLSECTRENFANGKTTRWASASSNGIAIGRFFTQEFGDNCKTKTLPQWLVDLPKKQLKSFLDGLLVGDGHVYPNGNWSITLANPELLLGVYNICLKLGISVSLQMQAKPSNIGTTKYVYVLRSLKDDSIKLSKFNADSGIVVGDLRYCPILSLKKLEQNVEVFDITVEEDNSFSAAGVVVHNCNSIHLGDSIDSIFKKSHELAMLSKNGAGVGIYFGDIRARGTGIKGNGKSEGVIPWCRVMDTTTVSTSQGGVRRGASAAYLPIDHGDIDEFLNIRRPTGDVNRRCLNLNHGVCINDEWMRSMIAGDKEKRNTWQNVLLNRVETGEPYLFFTDNVNNQNPDCYRDKGLDVKTSNICSEITLYTDPDHSFVCCLSSLNLVRWDEWKDTDTVEVAVRFLDAVLSEYITKSEGIPGLEASRRSAIKGRAIGIGVLGWHSLLQSKGLPFDSFESMQLNNEIFRTMRKRSDAETKVMAEELGEPEWCEGHLRRHTHCLAVAPTVSNSIISGGYSAGIEPLAANLYSQKSAKGTFIRKNPILENIIEEKGKNTPETWKSINEFAGSVQHLAFLSKEEKEVFLTAREINQHAIIKQAAQRQRWIDQGQSVNLFFASNSSAKYIHEVHMAAWESGLKTLYYFRSEGVIRGDMASRSKEECAACEG